jgi:hypothetical protein
MCNDRIGSAPYNLYPHEQEENRVKLGLQAEARQAVPAWIDKRTCQQLLSTRSKELEQQVAGLRRLAELIGAASDHDHPLFSTVLTMIAKR